MSVVPLCPRLADRDYSGTFLTNPLRLAIINGGYRCAGAQRRVPIETLKLHKFGAATVSRTQSVDDA